MIWSNICQSLRLSYDHMTKWPNGHSYSDDPTESQVITWQHDPEWSELIGWSTIMHNEVITWQQEVRENHSPHWLHLVCWRMPLNSCCRRKGLLRDDNLFWYVQKYSSTVSDVYVFEILYILYISFLYFVYVEYTCYLMVIVFWVCYLMIVYLQFVYFEDGNCIFWVCYLMIMYIPAICILWGARGSCDSCREVSCLFVFVLRLLSTDIYEPIIHIWTSFTCTGQKKSVQKIGKTEGKVVLVLIGRRGCACQVPFQGWVKESGSLFQD